MMRSDRTGRVILLIQALLLGGLATAGWIAAATSPTGVGTVAGFTLNFPHSALLLITAAASGLAALWPRVARAWAGIQAIGYTLLFLIGTAESVGYPPNTWLALNSSDNFLHLGVAIVGGVLATVVLVRPAALPDAADRMPQRRPTPRAEESAHTREMIAAEVAVAEGHATAEQARQVQEDARQRAAAERRRAWQHFRD